MPILKKDKFELVPTNALVEVTHLDRAGLIELLLGLLDPTADEESLNQDTADLNAALARHLDGNSPEIPALENGLSKICASLRHSDLPEDVKKDAAVQLQDGILHCTSGLNVRIKTILSILKLPNNLMELVVQWRYHNIDDVARKLETIYAKYVGKGLSVHLYNLVFHLANHPNELGGELNFDRSIGYPIAFEFDDVYRTNTISNLRRHNKLLDFHRGLQEQLRHLQQKESFLVIYDGLFQKMKNAITLLGYQGKKTCDDSYASRVFENIFNYVGRFFKPLEDQGLALPFSYDELFCLEGENQAIVDIQWLSIQERLFSLLTHADLGYFDITSDEKEIFLDWIRKKTLIDNKKEHVQTFLKTFCYNNGDEGPLNPFSLGVFFYLNEQLTDDIKQISISVCFEKYSDVRNKSLFCTHMFVLLKPKDWSLLKEIPQITMFAKTDLERSDVKIGSVLSYFKILDQTQMSDEEKSNYLSRMIKSSEPKIKLDIFRSLSLDQTHFVSLLNLLGQDLEIKESIQQIFEKNKNLAFLKLYLSIIRGLPLEFRLSIVLGYFSTLNELQTAEQLNSFYAGFKSRDPELLSSFHQSDWMKAILSKLKTKIEAIEQKRVRDKGTKILTIIKPYGSILSDNLAFMREWVEKYPCLYEYLSDTLKQMPIIQALAIFKQENSELMDALKNESFDVRSFLKSFKIKQSNISLESIQYFPLECRKNITLLKNLINLLSASQKNKDNFFKFVAFLDSSLKDNADFMFFCIQKQKELNVGKDYLEDRRDSFAFKYASDRLKNDNEFIKSAMAISPYVYLDLSHQLREKVEIIEEVVSKNPNFLFEIPAGHSYFQNSALIKTLLFDDSFCIKIGKHGNSIVSSMAAELYDKLPDDLKVDSDVLELFEKFTQGRMYFYLCGKYPNRVDYFLSKLRVTRGCSLDSEEVRRHIRSQASENDQLSFIKSCMIHRIDIYEKLNAAFHNKPALMCMFFFQEIKNIGLQCFELRFKKNDFAKQIISKVQFILFESLGSNNEVASGEIAASLFWLCQKKEAYTSQEVDALIPDLNAYLKLLDDYQLEMEECCKTHLEKRLFDRGHPMMTKERLASFTHNRNCFWSESTSLMEVIEEPVDRKRARDDEAESSDEPTTKVARI